jgi:hypothetical protein
MVNEAVIGESGYEMAEFTVTYSYLALGKAYYDTYRAGSPQEEGQTFEILFDPSDPQHNTGNDLQGRIRSRAYKAVALIMGLVVACFMIWLGKHLGI